MAKQATAEVWEATKKFKYQIKRDLSGDVQWVDMVNVLDARTSVSSLDSGRDTNNAATNHGWNFVRWGKVKLTASLLVYNEGERDEAYVYADVTALWKINGGVKAAARDDISCSSDDSCSSDFTIIRGNTAGRVSVQSSPNNLQLVADVDATTGDYTKMYVYVTARDQPTKGRRNLLQTVMA